MKIIVNDASILIDLFKIDLCDAFFSLPYEMHITDLVSSEITDKNADKLHIYEKSNSIQIRKLSFEELEEINTLSTVNPALSLPDCSCLWLCNKLSAVLLTTDGKLRKTAYEKGIPVHGILWLFDDLIKLSVIRVGEAASKLEGLMDINPRLPRDECTKRLKKWKTM